jgi:hypothetical protein
VAEASAADVATQGAEADASFVPKADAETEAEHAVEADASINAATAPSSPSGAEASGENPSIVYSVRVALPAAIAASIGAMSSVVQKSA